MTTAAISRGGLALAALFVAAGCSADPVQPSTPRASETAAAPGVPADADVLLRATSAGKFSQEGSADVAVTEVSLDGGDVTEQPGLNDAPAIDFPAFSADENAYPRAILAVTNIGVSDAMKPGNHNFTWGAEFRLDDQSQGTGVDNGNNLVQRGLSSHPTFFKLELDQLQPSCTVRGEDGELVVRSSEFVDPGTWYRVRCERTATDLAVYVTALDGDGTNRTSASHETGVVGAVSIQETSTPLTVGGKIGADGNVLRAATDQFNGLVVDPYLLIED